MADLPEQIAAGATVTTGRGLTVMVTLPVLIQPLAAVPVTEYVVVTVGVAAGLVHVLHERLPDGDHRYDAAPETDSGAEFPLQIPAVVPVISTGSGRTVTLAVSVAVQPLDAVPVTV